MSSFRSPSSLTILLCVQLSVCHLGSSAAVSSSLWGKKIQFSSHPCVWQLRSGTVVPDLKELSVCMHLRLNYATEWTGFVYKAPQKRQIELGLQGTRGHLAVWLFGEEQHFEMELKMHEWHSICLTWSGQAQRLRVYINGTSHNETSVNPLLPQQLGQNGTCTLGVSHYVDPYGNLKAASGHNLLGEISLFRVWAREQSAEEVRGQSCADGDVVSWDMKEWSSDCPPVPDNNSYCAWPLYKITISTFILDSTRSQICSVSLEEVVSNWLESIFPRNISVFNIFVSSQRLNNTAALHAQQLQGSRSLANSTCDQCFSCEVFVEVNPAANVEVVQAEITALLSLTFSYNSLNLKSDPESISIRPVESFPASTDLPPTVSTGVTHLSETGPTPTGLPTHHTDMSTTREPLDLNNTAVTPDKFFRVIMTLSMTGSPPNPQDIIETWVKEQLEVNRTMIVLNFIIKENTGRYCCNFHVQEYDMNVVAETISLIKAALSSKYENGSITIQSMNMTIMHIEPENCLEETKSTIYGQYIWPEAFPQVNQVMGCNEPKSERAYRLCELDIKTDATRWAHPDMRNCKPLMVISELDNITVTTDNAAEVVDMIQDLVDIELGTSEELLACDLAIVAEKLRDVVDLGIIEPPGGASIVSIVSNILLSKTDMAPVTQIVLNMTERMGNKMDFQEESVSITAPLLALSLINTDPDEFNGLTFGVASSSRLNPETFLNQCFVCEPLPDTDATISLPSGLEDFFLPGRRNKTRIQFNFYGTQKLFQDPLTTNATQSRWTLNSYIVSASINNSHVSNLKKRVVVTFKNQKPKSLENKVQCVFWDFKKNGGQGGWNSRGCETRSISSRQTSCLCDHLTHFAVLLDVLRAPVSEADEQILTVISYVGCGISSIFLGITLLTYFAFEKLRHDYPSKILINLSAALLGMNMLFLLNTWLSSFSNYGLCIATAATLHYFLLASFTWMGLEAVHMYLALVKVFNIYIPFYMLKLCAAGWGIPLVIVSLVLAIDKDAYGNYSYGKPEFKLQFNSQFCWLQNYVFYNVTVLAFVVLILLCNTFAFIVVLIQIRQMRANKPSANSHRSLQDLKAVASLTVLLGLMWITNFISFGPAREVLIYLFTIFNTLQGLFVFVFHCLMKENVRKQWRIHLSCGRFSHSDCSGWIRTVTAGAARKMKKHVYSDSAASDSTSTIRKTSDSSTGSAPNQHHEA